MRPSYPISSPSPGKPWHMAKGASKSAVRTLECWEVVGEYRRDAASGLAHVG